MHSRDKQHTTVKRVREAYGWHNKGEEPQYKWPSFDALPVVENVDLSKMGTVRVPRMTQTDKHGRPVPLPVPAVVYVECLYSACYQGVPVGRSGDHIVFLEDKE